jgi:phosphoribosylaminoimidazolecarboxamide formyltransferase / IMP cyclohydrolase
MTKNSGHPPKYALVSVYDKSGIVELARILRGVGYQIISTGGTAKVLTEHGIPVVPIQDITGNPESFGGRMKTISFAVEGGILYDRSNPIHVKEAHSLHIPDIGVVICNLYPFAETIQKPHVTVEEAVENIDVGGPTMIRSAAKNFKHILVVVDPSDYGEIVEYLHKKVIPEKIRRGLAAKAFGHLSFYDAQITRYLGHELLPNTYTIPMQSSLDLRYGDNPDQQAKLYLIPNTASPFRDLKRLAGREPSATNITDIDAGIRSIKLFDTPCAVVIKHNTPCGIALGASIDVALARALEADPESAFGGVVVLNESMTKKAVDVIAAFKQSGKGQMDIVAAPGYKPGAVESLSSIRKTTGVYHIGSFTKKPKMQVMTKSILGGAVIQTENDPEANFLGWETVTKKNPSKAQMVQMQIAWKFMSRIRSNTILVMDPIHPMTRGIGTGQTSRVLACKIALERAGAFAKGSVLASDSFFPFDDCVELAAGAGVTAIVQQGGSIRDADSIKAADRAGLSMVFTHQRVFWH